MKIDSFIRLLAGSMVLLSVILTHWVHPAWVFFTGFIGLNLMQSALTGFCPPSLILRKLGWVDDQDTIHWGSRRS